MHDAAQETPATLKETIYGMGFDATVAAAPSLEREPPGRKHSTVDVDINAAPAARTTTHNGTTTTRQTERSSLY